MINEDAAAFIDAWRARWPEWAVASVFVPPVQREGAAAWFALLQIWCDAAWQGDDATPGHAKLAWWQEELRGWAKGMRRHPLGVVLQSRATQWAALAEALPLLAAGRAVQHDADTLQTQLQPFAQVAARVEADVLEDASDASAAVLSNVLLAAGHSTPQNVMQGSAARRVLAAIASARSGQAMPVAPWRVLLPAWRAARAR